MCKRLVFQSVETAEFSSIHKTLTRLELLPTIAEFLAFLLQSQHLSYPAQSPLVLIRTMPPLPTMIPCSVPRPVPRPVPHMLPRWCDVSSMVRD